MKKLWLALLLLTACQKPVAVDDAVVPDTPVAAPAFAEQAAVAATPLPEAVAAVAPITQSVVIAAIEGVEDKIEAVPLPPPSTDTGVEACVRAAAALIVRWEVTSPGYYAKRLQRPVWPKGASGITWGVGYDGGHQTTRTILDDWTAHPDKLRLGETAGVRGEKARVALPKYRNIITPYAYAADIFETRSLVQYMRLAERVYRVSMEDVPVGVCAALASLAYNRGGATGGDARKEVRNIRDKRLPERDWQGVADEIRAMKRLWRGSSNENGLTARRESEAVIIETLR